MYSQVYLKAFAALLILKGRAGFQKSNAKYYKRVPKAGGGYKYYYTRADYEQAHGSNSDSEKRAHATSRKHLPEEHDRVQRKLAMRREVNRGVMQYFRKGSQIADVVDKALETKRGNIYAAVDAAVQATQKSELPGRVLAIAAIMKARTTKYIRREPTGNPNKPWKYFYESSKKTDKKPDPDTNDKSMSKEPIEGFMDETPTSAQIKRMVERLEQWYEHLDEKLQDDDSGEYAQKLQKKYGDDNPKEIVREYLTNDLYSKYDFVLNFREDLSEFGTQSPSNYDELVKKYDLARDRLDEMIQSRVEKEEDDFVTEAIDFLTNDRSLLYVTAKEDLAKKNEGYEEALQEIQAEQENILYKIGKAVEGITEVFRDSGLDVSTHFATTTNSVYITLENEDREEVRIRVADHQMAADMGGKTEPDYSIEFDFVPVPLDQDSKLNSHSTGDDDIEGTIMAAASDLGVDIDPEQAKKIHNTVHDSKGRLTSDEFLDQKFSNLRAREDYF